VTDGSEDDGQSERTAQAVAAAVGALVGLPFGPLGAVVGAATGPMLEPVAAEIIYLIGQAGKRRGGEALAETCEGTGLPVEETLSRIFSDDKSQLLGATAVFSAMRTAWEDKVRTLGRSLASGLLASDDAAVDIEQLIMSAIGDMEGPHLALLDLLVAWEPIRFMGDTSPTKLDIPSYSYTNGTWNVGWRKWTAREIGEYRPRILPVLPGLLGTLQRHGLALFESNSGDAIRRLDYAFREDRRQRQVERNGPRPRMGSIQSIRPAAPTWEPTELGEQVWLRFHAAGANVPDAWLTSSTPSPEA
jgi:hypothetical protein